MFYLLNYLSKPKSDDCLYGDMLWQIFTYLSPKELACVALVSRSWSELSQEDSLWRLHLKNLTVKEKRLKNRFIKKANFRLDKYLFDDAVGRAYLLSLNASWIDKYAQGTKRLIQNGHCNIRDVVSLSKSQQKDIENMSALIHCGATVFGDAVKCTPVQSSFFRNRKVRQLVEEGYISVEQTKSFNLGQLRNLRCSHVLIKAGVISSKDALALTLMQAINIYNKTVSQAIVDKQVSVSAAMAFTNTERKAFVKKQKERLLLCG